MTGELLSAENRRGIEEDWGIVARNFYGLADGGLPVENLTLIRNLMINNNIFNDYYLTICGIIFNDIHDSCKH
jgi:phenylacetate-coenzyme A ligase PaaK-like adenylate-forming protein